MGRSFKESNPSFKWMINKFALRVNRGNEKKKCFANCFPFTTEYYTINKGEEGNGSSHGSAFL